MASVLRTRRQLLRSASAAFLAAACRGQNKPTAGQTPLPPGGTMPQRMLGRTGVKVSLLGLGGYHLGIPKDPKESERILHMAVDHGVTFLDNCWDYHDGESERRMGAAIAGRRDKVFLMTKLDGQTKQSAARQLDESLRRLRTDYIDLVQMHEIIRPEDPDRIFAPGGAAEAYLEAKRAGKIRFVGFTGHKDPTYHVAMLEKGLAHGSLFDTVQMPLNVMDAHFKSFERLVLPRLLENDIGVLGMKPLGAGKILEAGVASADDCLRYAMTLDTDVVITGCDSVGVLEQALRTALTFSPLRPEDKASLLARTIPYAARGEYEEFKTSEKYDGTKQHPEWLGLEA